MLEQLRHPMRQHYRNGKAEPTQREPNYGFRVVCEINPVR